MSKKRIPSDGRLGWVASIAAASGKTSYPEAMFQHCKGLGWGCFGAGGRVQLDDFAVLLKEHPEIEGQFKLAPNKKIEDALLVRERRLDLEDKRRERKQKYSLEFVEVEKVERHFARTILEAKTLLVAAANDILIDGGIECRLTAEQKEKLGPIIDAKHHAVLEALSRGEHYKEAK